MKAAGVSFQCYREYDTNTYTVKFSSGFAVSASYEMLCDAPAVFVRYGEYYGVLSYGLTNPNRTALQTVMMMEAQEVIRKGWMAAKYAAAYGASKKTISGILESKIKGAHYSQIIMDDPFDNPHLPPVTKDQIKDMANMVDKAMYDHYVNAKLNVSGMTTQPAVSPPPKPLGSFEEFLDDYEKFTAKSKKLSSYLQTKQKLNPKEPIWGRPKVPPRTIYLVDIGDGMLVPRDLINDMFV